ncbi:MAG: hypothetical protein IPJ19_05680 [Planctomycetes bacterium]|nr:hypothetical protein [Planctomycetota bacterium]
MQPYVPEQVPSVALDWSALIPRLGRANRALATYAGILEAIPNQALLLAPLTTQEAVLSSKIEGTQATLGDVLKFEAGEKPRQPGREEDIHDVLNYRKALLAGEKQVGRRPFSLQILRGMHGGAVARRAEKTRSPAGSERGRTGSAPSGARSRKRASFRRHPRSSSNTWKRWSGTTTPTNRMRSRSSRGPCPVRDHPPVLGWERKARPHADPTLPVREEAA